MTVALQIRNVPDDVRAVIARTAKERGQSLQAYLLQMVTDEARRAKNVELLHHFDGRRIDLSGENDPVRIIREGRDGGFEIDRAELP
ncbi:MAG: hypothetical protein LBK95_02555 [Bifidobacteriaceae bacterium]|jgi:plasmid stability protein|nr:hypothetical protein [Bifidobacteriaceae bacterium]